MKPCINCEKLCLKVDPYNEYSMYLECFYLIVKGDDRMLAFIGENKDEFYVNNWKDLEEITNQLPEKCLKEELKKEQQEKEEK